jgi:hypothetical protein
MFAPANRRFFWYDKLIHQQTASMEIIGLIATIIVLGFTFVIWIMSLHLDDFISIAIDFVCVAAVIALILFIIYR